MTTLTMEDLGPEPSYIKDEREIPDEPQIDRGKQRTTSLERQLAEFYMTVGVFIFPVDQVCGQAIIDSAERCAKALDELAKTNPRVKKVLQKLVEASGWGGVLAAHLPLILAIDSHHRQYIPRAMQAVFQRQQEETVWDVTSQ